MPHSVCQRLGAPPAGQATALGSPAHASPALPGPDAARKSLDQRTLLLAAEAPGRRAKKGPNGFQPECPLEACKLRAHLCILGADLGPLPTLYSLPGHVTDHPGSHLKKTDALSGVGDDGPGTGEGPPNPPESEQHCCNGAPD
eukprot:13049929-Alexandrium_andersonii.AAC.1